MSYALSRPSSTQRSSLLLIVVGLHAGLLLLVMAAKTVVPQLMDMPLIIDLLPAPPVEQPAAKPLPVAKPQPVRAKPAAKTPTPVLETTTSPEPAPAAPAAPAAPLATPPEVTPAPPAPAAAPVVSQARFDADYLRNSAPPYPALSRRMGEEGKVVLRVSVSAEGTAEAVDIRSSSGSARLDEAAQKTVRNWRFIPAKRGDEAVQSWVLVPIIFKLEQ